MAVFLSPIFVVVEARTGEQDDPTMLTPLGITDFDPGAALSDPAAPDERLEAEMLTPMADGGDTAGSNRFDYGEAASRPSARLVRSRSTPADAR